MLVIRTFSRSMLFVVGAVALIAAASPLGSFTRFHAHLAKSEPAANDTLAASPHALRLWFSEGVELRLTSVKLVDAAGTVVALSPVTKPDTGEKAPVVTRLAKSLSPGSYTVNWSTVAKDGHPSKGTYGFVLKAAR